MAIIIKFTIYIPYFMEKKSFTNDASDQYDASDGVSTYTYMLRNGQFKLRGIRKLPIIA